MKSLAACLVLAAFVSQACGASGPPQPVLHVSPGGADGGRCTASAPCASFEGAYKAAKPGDVVLVSGGTYGPQRLTYDSSKRSSRHVTFEPAPNASVRVAGLDFGQAQLNVRAAQHVTVRNMRIELLRAWDGAGDLLWSNIRGRTFNVLSGDEPSLGDTHDIRVVGGSFGPCQAPRDEACTVTLVGTNVVVDGVTIRGVSSTDLANFHVDGMFIRGCRNCTIRNSKFVDNMITNIRIQNCCNLPDNRDITIANNWFEASVDADGVSQRGDAVDVDTPTPNLTFWNNSFSQNAGLSFADIDFGGSVRVVGNLMANLYGGCRAGITYANNLYIPIDNAGPKPCGPTDRRVRTFGYVNPSAFDFHITTGSPARRFEPARLCPRLDIDGAVRSGRRSCDAGADELQGPARAPSATSRRRGG
jgi:pectate lyase